MPSASNQSGPADIIGRETLIAELWHVLEERSLILSAERRFGKTYVIQQMAAHPPPGVLTFYQDVGAVQTSEQFAEKVCTGIIEKLPVLQKAGHKTGNWLSRLSGGKASLKSPHLGPDMPEVTVDLPTPRRSPWEDKLTDLMGQLVHGHPGRVVFFWDEVPWMIGHVKAQEGEAAALKLLDLLRSLRQDPQLKPKLRMVYTGSVGFHHVLAAPPVNDMKPHADVPPLDMEAACEYVRQRLRHEKAAVTEESETVQAIAEAANRVPFYVKNLVQSLNAAKEPIQPGDAEAFIVSLLRQPELWDLQHYNTRIDDYYAPAQRPIARALLDVVAIAGEVADFDTLFNLLKSRRKIKDEALARQVLDLLRQDHYLWTDPYRFQLPLIRRFWRAHHGLKTRDTP